MSRRRCEARDPLDARIDRLRAVWAILPAESQPTFLAKLDEIGRAWTGYAWQPEYTPPPEGKHP